MFDFQIRAFSEGAIIPAKPLWLRSELMAATAELDQAEAGYLCCYKGDVLKAVMPVYEKKRLGLRRLVAPLGSYYQGIWTQDKPAAAVSRELLNNLNLCAELAKYLKARYQRLRVNLHPHNADVRGFTWNGIKAVPLYTFVHDLSQPVSLLKDEKVKLKHALEQDYRFGERFEPEPFIARLKQLYERKHHTSGLNFHRLQRWMEALFAAGLLRQFNLTREGGIASSNILLCADRDIAYSVMRTTAPEDLGRGASALHTLKLAEALKGEVGSIDFCGANQPEVARFKAAFGFELKIFFQLHS
jgi:hypothetical protein